MARVEERRVDRGLDAQSLDQVPQQQTQCPLVLLIAPGRAEAEHRAALAGQDRRCQGRPRAPAGCEVRGQAIVQPEHLPAGRHIEPQARDRRGRLQPAA